MNGDKKLLVARSGISALRDQLAQALGRVPATRAHESSALLSAIMRELAQHRCSQQTQCDALLARQSQERGRFEQDLVAVFDKACDDVAAVVLAPGPDLALQLDAADDGWRLTAGRQERARLHVAFSRVCMQINAVLTQHSADELPSAQHTTARSPTA